MREEIRIKALKYKFCLHFKEDPKNIFLSPGRIELLGNHTDHNHGKVLVSSVNLNILAAVSPRKDKKIVVYSKGYTKMSVSLNALRKREKENGTSLSLIRGVAYKMKKLGYNIGGFSMVCDSTIYKGAGVSSSAAFEVLIGKILSFYYNDDKIEPFKLAQIAQFAESKFFNKPCGLLDQSGIALGGINYIDFKSTSAPKIQNLKVLNDKYQFLLINTGDSHAKLTPHYAAIKEEMMSIANFYGKPYLRNVKMNQFLNDKDVLIEKFGERAFLRAKHFFEENIRVQNAYNDLTKGNFETLLKMMDESGNSSYYQLQNCYVSNEDEKLPRALKRVKEIEPNCYSRVHGGGFAGTMLMIIKKKNHGRIYSILKEEFGPKNVMKVSLISEGTSVKE